MAMLKIENEAALGKLARRLAPLLAAGDVVTLGGPLGAGKTALARALIRARAQNPAEEVPSPTFTLVQGYELPDLSLWHFDLYRLEERAGDILELGWDDARRHGAVLVEWPERLGGLLPRDRLEITIGFVSDSENARAVTLTPHGSWAARLEGMTW